MILDIISAIWYLSSVKNGHFDREIPFKQPFKDVNAANGQGWNGSEMLFKEKMPAPKDFIQRLDNWSYNDVDYKF